MSDLQTTYSAFVAKLFNRTGDLSKDFSHAVLGLVTETHELRNAIDEINALEEAGDLSFFCRALILVVRDFLGEGYDAQHADELAGKVLEESLQRAEHDYPTLVTDYLVELMDAAKRWVGYGKEPTAVQLYELQAKGRVVHALVLAHNLGQDVTREQVLKANMAKLLKRYPGGEFDAFRAVVRDTEAEREALASV